MVRLGIKGGLQDKKQKMSRLDKRFRDQSSKVKPQYGLQVSHISYTQTLIL